MWAFIGEVTAITQLLIGENYPNYQKNKIMGIVIYTVSAFFVGCFVATVLLFFVMGSYHFENDEKPNNNELKQ